MLKRGIVTSDWHVPGHDRVFLDVFIDQIVPYVRPDVLGILGDVVTADGLQTKWLVPPTTPTLNEEVSTVRPLLARLRRAIGDSADLIFHAGNHEARLDKTLWSLRWAAGLPGIDWPCLLGLEDIGAKFVQWDEGIRVGPVELRHGATANKWAAYTAHNNLIASETHVICGHTHRMGMSCMDRHERALLSFEAGWAGLWRRQHYVNRPPNWQRGAAVFTFDTDDTWLAITPIYWTGSKAILGLETFGRGTDACAAPPAAKARPAVAGRGRTLDYSPKHPSPPGATIRDMLDERGSSVDELARVAGIPAATVRAVVDGAAPIAPAVGGRIEGALGFAAGFLAEREAQYRAAVAGRRIPDHDDSASGGLRRAARATDAHAEHGASAPSTAGAIVAALRANGPMRTAALVASVNRDRATVTRHCATLQEQGRVLLRERSNNNGDGGALWDVFDRV